MDEKIEDFKLTLTVFVVIIILMVKSCININSTVSYEKNAKTDVDALKIHKQDSAKTKEPD